MHPLRALIADGDPTSVEHLRRGLEDRDMAAIVVGSAEELYEIVDNTKVDGIFLNWDDPAFGLRTSAWRIRRSDSNRAVPITILTTSQENAVIADAWGAGINYHLTTPLMPEHTNRILAALHQQMLDERRAYQRVPLAVPVFCVGENDQRAYARSVNISASGMLLSMWPHPHVGSQLTLAFGLSGLRQEYVVRSTVIRSDERGRLAVAYNWHSTERYEELKTGLDERVQSLAAS